MIDAPYVHDPDGFCYAANRTLLTTSGLTPWRGLVDDAGFAVPGTEPEPVWTGRTVACLASGPSLTQEDAGRVRGFTRVVTNSTHWIAPDADAIYAGDAAWWQVHHSEVPATMARWTASVPAARRYDLNLLQPCYGVSGAAAIMLAARLGATAVILLGHDCSIAGGLHWHGAHEGTENPAQSDLISWRRQYRAVADLLRGSVSVMNCSRYTELDCFPTVGLDEAIESCPAVV